MLTKKRRRLIWMADLAKGSMSLLITSQISTIRPEFRRIRQRLSSSRTAIQKRKRRRKTSGSKSQTSPRLQKKTTTLPALMKSISRQIFLMQTKILRKMKRVKV